MRTVWRQSSPQAQLDELRRYPSLAWDWHLWARDEQLPPESNWTYWLILAGRGFGKTRTGAEWARQQIREGCRYLNLIGATADDARDIMIEGESGILAICPKAERPEYKASQRKLAWPNGATSLIFTADEPERLRGKQHEKLWADEIAAWRYPEAWDQAKFGLRLGSRPQACLTTTPKPSKIVRDLIGDPRTATTRGTTYENRDNLAPDFFSAVIKAYEGTRIGRQELLAEVLDDNPGALWTRRQIDDTRVATAPDLVRVVIGVDPSATGSEDSDECGIVAAGMGADDDFYVLEDASLLASPQGWARQVSRVFSTWNSDRVVAETNNGGDMVEAVLRNVDPDLPYKKVTASRGKMIRAEPIAALYEQGKVHHVGSFPKLEDQMCNWNPIEARGTSPDRMDALVWALTELSSGANIGILGYYRREAEALKQAREQPRA